MLCITTISYSMIVCVVYREINVLKSHPRSSLKACWRNKCIQSPWTFCIWQSSKFYTWWASQNNGINMWKEMISDKYVNMMIVMGSYKLHIKFNSSPYNNNISTDIWQYTAVAHTGFTFSVTVPLLTHKIRWKTKFWLLRAKIQAWKIQGKS